MKKLRLETFCITVSLILCASLACGFGFNLSFDLGGGQSGRLVDLISGPLSFNPSSKAFNNQSTNTERSQAFVISNPGTADAEEITTSLTNSTGFRIYSSNCGNAPFTIVAGATCSLKVGFKPLVAGNYSSNLKLTWTNRDDVTAALSGTGVNTDPPTTPVISVTPGDTQNVIALTSGGTGATSYNLLWGLSTGDLPNTITGATLPYTHTGRTNGTPYYYVLNAINANGTTASSEVSGTPAASSFTDNFNRAAGALGINWTNLVGTLLIGSSSAANSVVASAATPSYAIWSANTLNDNQYSQITFSAANDGTRGACVRLSGATATGYCLISVTTSRTDIMRYNSGGGTVLTSITGMAAYVGKTGKITVSGSNPVVVTAYLDGSQIGTYSDSSASRVATGAPGIMSRETYGPLIDNFEAGNL